jgi:hypothetical protein
VSVQAKSYAIQTNDDTDKNAGLGKRVAPPEESLMQARQKLLCPCSPGGTKQATGCADP